MVYYAVPENEVFHGKATVSIPATTLLIENRCKEFIACTQTAKMMDGAEGGLEEVHTIREEEKPPEPSWKLISVVASKDFHGGISAIEGFTESFIAAAAELNAIEAAGRWAKSCGW